MSCTQDCNQGHTCTCAAKLCQRNSDGTANHFDGADHTKNIYDTWDAICTRIALALTCITLGAVITAVAFFKGTGA